MFQYQSAQSITHKRRKRAQRHKKSKQRKTRVDLTLAVCNGCAVISGFVLHSMSLYLPAMFDD